MPPPVQPELALRIVVEQPLPGVLLRLQRGRDELVEPTESSAARTVFDFTVRLGAPRAGGAPNFLGPNVQGPPATRFVYINAGSQAGQPGTPWDRRAKIGLTGITAAQVREALATPGSRLEVRIPGAGRDGGPICATVPLPPGAWRLTRNRGT